MSLAPDRQVLITRAVDAAVLGATPHPIDRATAAANPHPAATINNRVPSFPFCSGPLRQPFFACRTLSPSPTHDRRAELFHEIDSLMIWSAHNEISVDWQQRRQLLLRSYTAWLEANPKPSMDQPSTLPEDPTTTALPIALRCRKRRSSVLSPVKDRSSTTSTTHSGLVHHDPDLTPQPTTPARKRSKKRVRFSAPSISRSLSRLNTTGLTPSVCRASLATPRRRVSAPARTPPPTTAQEIQFTPFRQVLDERCKRRIRRNGLSEEGNDYEADKKTKADLEKQLEAKDNELRKLREELEVARATHANDAPSADEGTSSQRIDEVEAELAALRESFNAAFDANEEFADIDWDHVNVHKAGVTPGPQSEGGDTIQIWEDDDAGAAHIGTSAGAQPDCGQDADLLAMALDLEAAKHEKRQLFRDVRHQLPGSSANPPASFEFADSPSNSQQSLNQSINSLPSPPKDFYRNLSAALKATTCRAEDTELALLNLDNELKALGFKGSDASSVIAEIAAQFRNARLELERAVPGETVSAFENAKVLPEIIARVKSLVRQLEDKEAELRAMRDQQKTLRGNFEHAIMASDKSNHRVRELENAIDTGAEEMLETRMKFQALEKEGAEKDKSISALITALEKYREDVTKLEQLVTQLEGEMAFKIQEAKGGVAAEKEQLLSDLEAKVAAEERGRRAAETSAVDRLATIKDLGAKLENAQRHAFDVQLELNALAASKEEEEFKLKKKLLERDEQAQAQLGALNTRISNLSTALASANAEVEKLKVHKVKLEERVRKEVELGERAVEVIKEELMRSLGKVNETKNSYVRGAKIRVANGELRDADEEAGESGAEPMTPVSLVRFVDVEADEEHVEGSVEVSRGKGRRSRSKGKHSKRGKRSDSGIGMGTLSDGDQTDGMDELSDGVGEFSLDGDDEVDVDMMER